MHHSLEFQALKLALWSQRLKIVLGGPRTMGGKISNPLSLFSLPLPPIPPQGKHHALLNTPWIPTSAKGHLPLDNSACSGAIYTQRREMGTFIWQIPTFDPCRSGNFRGRSHCSWFENTTCVFSTPKRAKQPWGLQIFAFCNCHWVSSSGLSHQGHVCFPSHGLWAGND